MQQRYQVLLVDNLHKSIAIMMSTKIFKDDGIDAILKLHGMLQ